jgi:RNA polymerase sigma-70 factor (ECF subfamily)
VTLESRPGHVPGEFTPGPLVETDPVFVATVDEAVIGDVFADSPEAQPDRKLIYTTDFSSLYIRHRSSLAIHARRFLTDSRDIDEVVQETFLRLFLASSEIETELQAIAFARRTLTNLCIDRYRAERRRPQLLNLDESQVYDLGDETEADDPVLRAEDAAVVREALALLSPLHRAALIKREIEEKPLPQIAAELDVPEESVKHLLFRARRALRRLLVGTSVEPGVELSVGDVVSIANRRAARAVMQSANALMILFVGAIVVAFGLKGFIEQPDRVTGSGAASESSGGVVVAPSLSPVVAPPTSPHAGSTSASHAAHRGSAGTTTTATPPPVTPSPQHTGATTPTHRPTTPPGDGGGSPPAGGGHSTNARSHFALNGPLQVEGSPRTDQVVTQVNADNTQTSVSQFTASTSEGVFALTQTLVQPSAGGAPSVSVQPAFVIGNAVQIPQLIGSSASVSPNPDGTISIDVVAATVPDPSSNVFQLSSVDAHFVMAPTLDRVLSETVTVQATAASSAPTSPLPAPAPSGTPVSGNDAALAICPMSDGSDTPGGPCVRSGAPA